MSGRSASLEARFCRALSDACGKPADTPVVVAVSGGLDSCVLLHLLCFSSPVERARLVVAHFDHRMRADSADDARWVAGLAAAWGLDVRIGAADAVPRSEDDARSARYRFLHEVRRDMGAALVLTAHHADDQAETVLFRLLRGAGPHGLSGMPAHREPGVFRPLLGFWREELEAYAERARLSWREDATNFDPRYARNVLRARVLPEVERLVAPGARRALVRLARLSREDEEGWASVLPDVMAPLSLDEMEGRISVDRRALVGLHRGVRARVLRALSMRMGLTLDERLTRLVVDFAEAASSGSAIDLGRAVTLRRELDRLVLVAGTPVPARDRPLEIPDTGPGSGEALLGGLTVRVAWGGPEAAARLMATDFARELLHFPLLVRARAPGDAVRVAAGRKKVKKLLLERRIPSGERERVPLVVDAEGEVLWIPGVARAHAPESRAAAGTLTIGIG